MRPFKEVLDDFLRHPQKRVLAIKGKWGVGKTYAWHNYLLNQTAFRGNATSYVSLFGAENLSDIKRLILEKAILLKAKEFNRFVKGVRSTWTFAKMLPKVSDFANAAHHLEELLIRDFLICLDDLERRSDKLALDSVFGLVSSLKEENHCKVVLIFNENELNASDQVALKRYREKVIDLEFTFSPSIADNVRLIFRQEHPALNDVIDVLEKLDIGNIRVIQQVAWALEIFEPLTVGSSQFVRDRLLRNVIILTSVFNEYGDEVDVVKLNEVSFASFLLAKGEQTRDTSYQILSRVTYIYSAMDVFIVDVLQNGNLDAMGLKRCLIVENEREHKASIQKRLFEMWQLFNGNFQATKAEIISQFEEFLNQHSSELHWGELTQACSFLKQLDSKIDCDQWMSQQMEKLIPALDAPAIQMFKNQTRSPELLEKLELRNKQLQSSFGLKDTIFRIVQQQGWNPEDTSALDGFAEEDYYQWLLEEKDHQLLTVLREFRRTFNGAAGNKQWESIGNKLEAALRRVGARSNLDSERLKLLLGIDIKPQTQPPPR